MIKMKNLIRENNNILHVLYLTYFSLVVLFGRSFTGIYFFGFRLGELMIASAVLLSVIILLLPISSKNIILGKENLIIHKLIILSFFTTFLLTNGDITNTYTFQSSSYVWTYSFVYLSYFILKNYKIKKQTVYLVAFFLPALYILSTINFPEFLIEFFRQPDVQIGYLFNLISMGTLLSFLMIIAGLIIFNILQKKNEY